MKHLNKILLFALTVVTFGLFSSCSNLFEEEKYIVLSRCLEPMNLSARVVNGNQVTFNWDVTKDAANYNLVIYTDAAMETEYANKTIAASEVPYTLSLEADASYWFKVQASNAEKGLKDSKWAFYQDKEGAYREIKTYAVKDQLFMKATAKTSSSISVAWSTEVADYKEVDRLEYRLVGSEEIAGTHILNTEEIDAAAATITGLEPSTQYVVTLYFKSASRGEVTLFTSASTEGFTAIASLAAFNAAIATPDAKILLKPGTYTLEDGKTFEIPGPLTIVGEENAEGVKPVIQGEFHILGTATGSIKFEGVALDGVKGKYGFAIQLKNGGGITNDVVLDEISFKNCEIFGFSKGLIYEWGQPLNVGKLNWESCYIHDINSDGTGGGDVIDFRGAADKPLSTIGAINIVDNTIVQGGRTFLRIDFPKSLGAIKFENNTLYNLCLSDNTNNVGLIGLQTAPTEMSFKHNLILAMGEKAKLGAENTVASGGFDGYKYWHGFTSGNNHCFGNAETFFNSVFTNAGFSTVAADPCYNAAAGDFNLTDNALVAAKVGASKWWTAFTKEPEDLTLGLISGNHTWNFGNPKFFSGTMKENMVRDLLFIGATGDNPIVSENNMLNFTAPAVCSRKGVPSAGYLAFKVDKSGSVLVKAEDPTGAANHITVGVGSLDGSSIAVKGGAMAMAYSNSPTKIVIRGITEESMVYVYPSGVVSLSQLAWSNDVSYVNTALPAPAPKASPASVTAGEASNITISWDPVENAASYTVVFNKKANNVEDGATSYVIGATTVGMLDPGSYSVEVYANPGEDDIYNTESEAGIASFAILPKADGGGETGTVVKNLEQLNAALSAGKTDITIDEGANIDFSAAESKTITPLASLHLTGRKGATITGGNFKFTGADCADFSLENVKVVAGGQAILLEFDAAGATMNSLKLNNVVLDGFSKSVIYGNAETNSIDEVSFKGLTVLNQGTGQGMFDLRKGSYSSLVITESTLTGGRDLIRMDAGVANGVFELSKNTLYAVNAGNHSNGVLYVRSASNQVYNVSDNLFLNITALLGKNDAAVRFPTFTNNFYYGMGENVFTGKFDEASATAAGGVVLTTDPVKDAANNDFTLTSGLAMSNKVGDPRWNPAYDAGASSSFVVKSKDEFDAAISAGKTEIIFAAEGSPYDLSASPTIVVAGLRLSGEIKEGKRPTVTLPELSLSGDLGSLIIEDLDIIGPGADGGTNFLSTGGVAISKIIVQNCSLQGFKKSVIYGNSTEDNIGAIRLSNVQISDLGAGQGTFDFRKSPIGSFTLENSTVVGGRDLLRADASTISGSIAVSNNTFVDVCGSKGNTNGILYVRTDVQSFVFARNLVMYPALSTRIFSKTGCKVPELSSNVFYNTDEATYWAGAISKEQAIANGGAVVSSSPVKDLDGGDYTLTDALCLSSNVGDPRWNPNAGTTTTEITVSSVDEFLNALSAGKTAITLKYGTYDFRTAENTSGDITLASGITIMGQSKGASHPVIQGALQLDTGISTLVLKNLCFDGDGALGVAVNIKSAITADKIQIDNCEFKGYTKSVYYNGSGSVSAIGSMSFNNLLVHDLGTGQGMIDIRGGTIGALIVSNSSFYNGGRDFLRCDKEIASSIAIKNNTFASCSIDAGNGLLWIRSCAADPSKYTVSGNLFLNLTGSTKLAKTGATVPVMSGNFFFNVGESFFADGVSAISQDVATGNGGAILGADPCTNSANFELRVTDPAVKAAGAGDPRWL
jgi:hypothetical protein